MARAMDIQPRRKSSPPPPPAPRTSPRRRRSSGIWLFFVLTAVIIGVIVTQPALLNPLRSTKNANSSTPAVTANKTVSTANQTKTPSAGQPKIQILNGTGIETITNQVKKTLEDNNYPVNSASLAQYEYAQTYVYYRPNAANAAKTISELLVPYKPTLSESQIAGLFDILIIIGKDNLPPAQ